MSFQSAISTVVMALAQLGNTVGRVLEDRKISGSEYLDLLLAAPHVQTIVVQAPQAAKDWNVLSDSEREQAISMFAVQFNIPQVEVEAKIEATLRDAANIYTAADRLVKSLKNINKTWKREAEQLPAPAPKKVAAQPAPKK
jgi:hypothetical protein